MARLEEERNKVAAMANNRKEVANDAFLFLPDTQKKTSILMTGSEKGLWLGN